MSADSLFVPELSVVVVAGERHDRVQGCLRSVFNQDIVDRLEVIAVDCAREDSSRHYSDYENLRLIRPAEQLHYGEALAVGVRQARAPVVAFLEEHARAHAGWARALLDAHRDHACAAVACEVHVGNPGKGFSDGWGLMGYGMWYPPLPPGETNFVHGYNSACKRDVLMAYGDRLPRLLLADTAFAHRLVLDGHQLRNAPDARIDHLNESALLLPLRKAFLAHRFSGPARAEECDWPRWRRWAYAAAAPLLPFYGLWSQTPRLWRRRPALVLVLLRILPLFVLNHLAMGAGAAIGLLWGPGRAARDFTLLELNVDRPE